MNSTIPEKTHRFAAAALNLPAASEKKAAIQKESALPPFIPYRQWPKYFSFPSVGTLKVLLLRRKSNGFSRCVRLINGRIYLSVEETLQYFNAQADACEGSYA